MKNIIKTSIFAFMLLALGSCTNDKDAVATSQGGPVLLTPESGSEFVLSPANDDNIAATLVWDHSDFGVPSSVDYTVEIAEAGSGFADPIMAGTTSSKFLSWTVAELNDYLAAPRFAPFTQNEIDVRIKASLGTAANAMIQYSNVITIKVTPYSKALPRIAVPGNHQGWSPPTAPTLASSGYGKTNYEGYVSLDGEYKFLSPKPDGTFDWGTTDWADDGSFSGVLIDGAGETNCSATQGYYRLKANTGAVSATNPNGLTYSATPISTWGVIGDATPNGWGSSTPMVYDSVTKKWTITVVLIGGKQLKFRPNNDWPGNLGGFDASKVGDDYGGETMSYDGTNIDVATDGTYVVTLDLSNPRAYTYTLVAQ